MGPFLGKMEASQTIGVPPLNSQWPNLDIPPKNKKGPLSYFLRMKEIENWFAEKEDEIVHM